MSNISESDRAEMKEFISNMIIILNTLGHSIFEQLTETEDSAKNEYFYFNATRGAKVKGNPTQEGFLVLAAAIVMGEALMD